MTYKTVLVHCNDRSRIARVLGPAVEAAATFDAHLIGLSIVPPVLIIPTGMPGTPDTVVIDEHCQTYRREVPDMKAAFEAAGGSAGSSRNASMWTPAAGTSPTSPSSTRMPSISSLRPRPNPNGQAQPTSTSRTVLPSAAGARCRKPERRGAAEPFRQGAGGLNGRREAARATFDALPLLRRAREVKVAWVNPESEGDVADGAPAADICTALARHGVKCEATEAVRPHAKVGETLLLQAQDQGADLLVMGCYGHSRLREFVLGGASEHVLRHMTIPILMSH